MPWDPEEFASKHNHKLKGKAARGASEAANKALAGGKDDASAIRIGNYVGDRVMGAKGYAKGGDMEACSYAEGGAVLGRTRSFVKEPDQFRGVKKSSTPGTAMGPIVQKDVPQDYKGGKGPHKDKSKSPPMPRK